MTESGFSQYVTRKKLVIVDTKLQLMTVHQNTIDLVKEGKMDVLLIILIVLILIGMVPAYGRFGGVSLLGLLVVLLLVALLLGWI